MKNNKIIIDMDSVLSKFSEKTIEIFNKKYDTNYKLEDIKSWDMDKWLNCKPEQLYEIWTPNFFLSVEPREYAKQMFRDLRDMGFMPVVVTAYNATTCVAKTQWLGKYIGLDEKDIIFCNNKYLVNGAFRLDDRIKNFFDENMDVIKYCEHFVFNQPYNVDGVEGEYKLRNYYSVDTLKEFVEIIRNIKKKDKIK